MSCYTHCTQSHIRGHCKMWVTCTVRAQEWAVRHAGRCYTSGAVIEMCFSLNYKHSADPAEPFNRLPDTKTAAPGNGVKNEFLWQRAYFRRWAIFLHVSRCPASRPAILSTPRQSRARGEARRVVLFAADRTFSHKMHTRHGIGVERAEPNGMPPNTPFPAPTRQP